MLLLIATYLVHAFLFVYGLPGQMMLYLVFFLFCFYKAHNILLWIDRQSTRLIIITGIPLIIAIAILFCFGFYDRYHQLSEWLGVIGAVLIAITIMKIARYAKKNGIVNYIAGISFEIYLIHHNFAFGRYSIMTYVNNPYIGFILLLGASVIGAYIFKNICYMFFRLIKIYSDK